MPTCLYRRPLRYAPQSLSPKAVDRAIDWHVRHTSRTADRALLARKRCLSVLLSYYCKYRSRRVRNDVVVGRKHPGDDHEDWIRPV